MPDSPTGVGEDVKKALSDKWVKIGAIAGVGVLILTVVLFMRGGGTSSDGGQPTAASGADLTGIGSELSQLATGQAQILDMLGGSITSTLPSTGNGDAPTGPAPLINPVVPSVGSYDSHHLPTHGDPHGPAIFFRPTRGAR